jgi:hypothetical protein
MINAINANPIIAARHMPSQIGGSGGILMLVLVGLGLAGDGTRRGWLLCDLHKSAASQDE